MGGESLRRPGRLPFSGEQRRGSLLRRRFNDKGQMTVEFMVVAPVLIVIVVIAVNALLFFGECAAFDNAARDTIRCYGTSAGYGQSTEQRRALMQQSLESRFQYDFEQVDVAVEGQAMNHVCYTASLSLSPTLFGLGLKSSVFGVSLPKLNHRISLVVDPYKPGVVV